MKMRWRLSMVFLLSGLLLVGCKDDAVETELKLNDMAMFEHIVSTDIAIDPETGDSELIDDAGFIVKNDTVYVTSNTVNLRKEPSAEAELVATVGYGTALNRTGRGTDGWDRLFYENGIVYVSNQYVTSVKIQEERGFDFSPAMLSIVDTSRQIYGYDHMVEDLTLLRNAYGAHMQLNVLGTTVDNRSIFEVVIGNPKAKKHIYIQASTCGAEYMSTLVCMKQIEYYLCYYETGNYKGFAYKDLFENAAIHVIPMLNPDGVTISQEYLAKISHETIADNLRNWFERDQSAGGTSLTLENYLMFYYANAEGVDIRYNFDYRFSQIAGTAYPGSMNFKGIEAGNQAESKALLLQLTKGKPDLVISYHTSGAEVVYNFGQAEPLLSVTKQYADCLGEFMNYEVKSALTGVDGYGSYEGYCNMVASIPALRVALGNGSTPLYLNEFSAIWNACRESWAVMQLAVIDY